MDYMNGIVGSTVDQTVQGIGYREMQPPASLGLSYFREDR